MRALRRFGESIGLAFQIMDDLLDVEGTEAEVGKKLKKDTEKQTYVRYYGVAASKARIDSLVDKAVASLRFLGPRAEMLVQVGKFHRSQVLLMLLDAINTPRDIRELTPLQLASLADEIRELIIRTISKTGGHLSSNLGVVELTLALHYVFDTPNDKIVWDVGHQCYTHKILTGRKERFSTIRQNEGLSGFPCRKESPFTTPSTPDTRATPSRSPRVLPRQRRRNNQTHRIVAVIGDGSLTGGMSFEALNHAGHLKSDIIVVLNDNEMSISKNVGALSAHLNRIMTGEFMSGLREDIKHTIRNLPAFGDKVYKAARYFEEAVKGLVTPGLLFEELGFQYVGPVDGHNLNHLILNLANIKKLKGPILVHVVTKKGKGYEPAVKDPSLVSRHLPVRYRERRAGAEWKADVYRCLR